jgi:hypothetical protein
VFIADAIDSGTGVGCGGDKVSFASETCPSGEVTYVGALVLRGFFALSLVGWYFKRRETG